MNKPYQIITDSSCDLPQAIADELDLVVIPMQLMMEGHVYKNYLDAREIGFEEYFQKIRNGSTATTSAINPEEFTAVFESYLKQGLDILYIGFSSGLSTTYQSSCIAAADLREKYPERKIITVDSLCASLGQGLLCYLAGKKKQEGASMEELEQYILDTIPNICHWFTVDDLMHLKRGGRVSATTAVVGTMLHIKPILHTDNDGHLASVFNVKGRKASLRALAQKAIDTGIDLPSQTIFLCHGDCEADAAFVGNYIKEQVGCKEVIINYVGPVIGAHTGVGLVAVFFLGTER